MDGDDFDVYVTTDASGNPSSAHVANITPVWEGQATTAVVEQHTLAGDVVHYTSMDYVGIQLTGDPDVTGKQSLSISLWAVRTRVL